MSIFSRIKDAIFGHKTAVAPEPTPAGGGIAQGQPAPTIEQQPVDVEQVLTSIAASKGNPDLNYKTSIVDLMKLLDMDSGLDNRQELATELGYSGDKNGSAEMNIWLHKAVMKGLADNGGRVPGNMLA